MGSPITVKIGGKEYIEAKSASVRYSIEEAGRSFAFTYADRWLHSAQKPLPFEEGDEVQIAIEGNPVVDGYVDEVPLDYDESSRSVQVTGRSWTSLMNDASAVYKSGSWRKVKLDQIAKDLAAPFGITVKVDPWAAALIGDPFAKWAIDDEETALGCIQRAASMRGLFLTADEGRTLHITKSSPVMVPGPGLVFGVHMKRGRRMGRFSERYSYYLAKAQSTGSDTWFGDDARGAFFKVEDPQVKYYKPLVIVMGNATKVELENKASWEATVRAGRSRRLIYDLVRAQDFLAPDKKPWPVNRLVSVNDPQMDVSSPLLIAAVTYQYNAQGRSVQLELAHPDAFDVLKPPKKRKKSKGFFDA